MVIDQSDDVIRGTHVAEDAGVPPPTSHVEVNTAAAAETVIAPNSSQISVFSGWIAEDSVDYSLADWLSYDYDSSSFFD